MNDATLHFITEHENSDVFELSLQASKYPDVDMPLAVAQINGRKRVKTKIPTFYRNNQMLYPPQLSLEQASSEITAMYKSTLLHGHTLVDLTGGFGIDCFFVSTRFQQVYYVEKNSELCRLAKHNFRILGAGNIQIINDVAEDYLNSTDLQADWIYIDPARRDIKGNKMVSVADCEPDVAALLPRLMLVSGKIMVKLSPMIDISRSISDLPGVTQVHLVSVDNECKEVLLLIDKNEVVTDIRITTVNFLKNGEKELFSFGKTEEESSVSNIANEPGSYLYEPNASVMKSGAFKLAGSAYHLKKLHVNTHLYTADELIPEFPGRKLKVARMWGFSKNELKKLKASVPRANVVTRNFPLKPEELRKKAGIGDGGEVFLYGCKTSDERNVIIECVRI